MKSITIDQIKLMKEWRHRIHSNPELGFEEQMTSQFVIQCLISWGYKVTTGLAETGVVGQKVFGDGSGPKIGLRADMDALPMTEENDFSYKSKFKLKSYFSFFANENIFLYL